MRIHVEDEWIAFKENARRFDDEVPERRYGILNPSANAPFKLEDMLYAPDLPTQEFLKPPNIDKGVVLAGWRHGNVIHQLVTLTGYYAKTGGEKAVGANTQGFLTSTGRFVDRKEAGAIAFEAGQITKPTDCLFSEDIY